MKQGDRVKISTSSQYYNRTESSNPLCEGVIRSNQSGYIVVDWDNGEWNSYCTKDLIIINSKITSYEIY